jgi:biotin transport system substrate-specific component
MSISRPYIFMWTIVGLFLTIGANFLPVYITSSPWQWLSAGVTAYPLGFKCQVGAVLLVSCLGGRTAGVLAQVAYLLVGLLWLKVFNDGGGIEYLQKPAFGYLLGFIPGAWVCGQLAFRRFSSRAATPLLRQRLRQRQDQGNTGDERTSATQSQKRGYANGTSSQIASTPPLEYLGLSCLCGLLTIHFIGIIYLILFHLINWQQLGNFKLLDAIAAYSIYPFFSQLVLACAATSIAFVLRKIMFY